ncbi:hypothetical protein Bca101_014763 [Brassica carinata]
MARKTKLRKIESVSVPHHVVEPFMERLPVKSLLSFKTVSKQWKSTIESRYFQERQLKHRQQSGDPDVLMITTTHYRLSRRLLRAWNANFEPGFGKDECTGIHKPVWLYNSFEVGLENATTCEVFDFRTSSWRYVTPSIPCRILGGFPTSVFVDGSLHWFTECEETKVLSFDLQAETFEVVTKAPFASNGKHLEVLLCKLSNLLCVSQMTWPDQVIWSFNSFNKTWDKLWSIDLARTWLSFGFPTGCALSPLAIFVEKEKKKKLLFYDRDYNHTLVIHDPDTQSYDAAFSDKSIGYTHENNRILEKE